MLILKTIDRAIEIIMKAVIVASMLVMAVLLFAPSLHGCRSFPLKQLSMAM